MRAGGIVDRSPLENFRGEPASETGTARCRIGGEKGEKPFVARRSKDCSKEKEAAGDAKESGCSNHRLKGSSPD